MKTIRDLIIKGFFFFLPVIAVWAFLATHPMSYLDGESASYIWNRDQTTKANDKGANILILGDSSANAAYLPEVLSGDTLNLAMGGSTTIENYYALKEYLEHNPAPEYIFVSFTDDNLDAAYSFWTRCVFTHRLKGSDIIEILRTAKKYDETSVLTDTWLRDFIEYELYMPGKYMTPLINSAFGQRYDENADKYQQTDIRRGSFIAKDNEEFHTGEYGRDSFYMKPFFDDYYKRMLALAEENGIEVYIVKLPNIDFTVYSDEYCQQLQDYYADIESTYDNVHFYWMNERYDGHYCQDTLHLNLSGQLRFSSALKETFPEIFSKELSELNRVAILGDMQICDNYEELSEWARIGGYTLAIDEESLTIEQIHEFPLESLPRSFTVDIIDQNGEIVCKKVFSYSGDAYTFVWNL